MRDVSENELIKAIDSYFNPYIQDGFNIRPNDWNILWEDFNSLYNSPYRFYHNKNHINTMLCYFDKYEHLTESPELVELAIFFHDVVWHPISGESNEEASSILITRCPYCCWSFCE